MPSHLSPKKNSSSRAGSHARPVEDQTAVPESSRRTHHKKAKTGSHLAAKIILFLVIILLIVAIAVALYIREMIKKPNASYSTAIELKESGKYLEAYELFEKLGNYKDSDELRSEISVQYMDERLMRAEIGDVVSFGRMEQDNDEENGPEEILWTIADRKGNLAMLISNYALDCRPYNTSWTSTSWESCSLRSWLNGDFYNNMFNDMERLMISNYRLPASKNPLYGIKQGEATMDHIFLLSIQQTETYFPTTKSKQCVATPYAIARGAYSDNGKCRWWLRTLGDSNNNAVNIGVDGTVRYSGNGVDFTNFAVRPALWIDLKFLNDANVISYFFQLMQDPDLTHVDDALEVLRNRFGTDYESHAFKAAVKAGNFDYVEAHIDTIDLNPNPGNISTYLLAAKESKNKDMEQLLVEHGALSYIEYHSAGR